MVVLIAIIAGIAIPWLAASRMGAREAAAISHLRLLKSVMEQYRMDNSTYALTMTELINAGYITGFDIWVDDISRTGYMFHLDPGPDPDQWAVQANPLVPGFSGRRFFRLTAGGDIRYNRNGPALDTDPVMY